MKKIIFFILIILVTFIVVYSFQGLSKVIKIDNEYKGMAYKLNESQYGKNITIVLKGKYNTRDDTFNRNKWK